MATNHTTHYDLNQWQATDQVLRTDFNADNVRLEAALAALEGSKLGHIQTIRSTALESASYHIDLDLTGINWSKWAFVGSFFGRNTTLASGNNSPSLSCELAAGASNSVPFRLVPPAPFFVLFFPQHNSGSLVEGIYISKSGSGPFFLTCTYEELDTMTVRYNASAYTLNTGTDITLWGIA